PIFYQVVHGTTCCRARFMTPLLLTSPEQQLREEWATPLRAQREVFRCAHDARFLHVTFHLVQAAEHFERLLEAFVLASLVNLSSRVRHAACSLSLARLRDVVVSRVLIYHEHAFGVTEHLGGDLAPARLSVRVDRELFGVKGPHESLWLAIRLLDSRLICLHHARTRDQRAGRGPQGLQFIRGSMEERIHRA